MKKSVYCVSLKEWNSRIKVIKIFIKICLRPVRYIFVLVIIFILYRNTSCLSQLKIGGL